jgi:hypothetical protein
MSEDVRECQEILGNVKMSRNVRICPRLSGDVMKCQEVLVDITG